MTVLALVDTGAQVVAIDRATVMKHDIPIYEIEPITLKGVGGPIATTEACDFRLFFKWQYGTNC